MFRIPRKKKMTTYEKRAQRQQQVEAALRGKGVYVFENTSKGDLWLPKPSLDGSKGPIPPGGRWKGDDYFTQLVRNRDARIVEILVSPQEQIQEQAMQKLLVDQPDRVTVEGTIEQVMPLNEIPLNEGEPISSTPKGDVLITEDPMAGVEILID